MTAHEKIYREFFGIGPEDVAPCERCIIRQRMGLQKNVEHSDDVHHVDRRGSGGDPQGKKDTIENLGGACRACHKILDSEPDENELFGQWCKELNARRLVIQAFLFAEI